MMQDTTFFFFFWALDTTMSKAEINSSFNAFFLLLLLFFFFFFWFSLSVLLKISLMVEQPKGDTSLRPTLFRWRFWDRFCCLFFPYRHLHPPPPTHTYTGISCAHPLCMTNLKIAWNPYVLELLLVNQTPDAQKMWKLKSPLCNGARMQ